jgi:uncharacterized protein YjiS (DUF1127 family)
MYRYKSLSSGFSLPRSITAAFGGLPRVVMNKLMHVMEIRRQRRALERLDDRLLKDIGITRCDVDQEVSRSLWR